MLAKVWEEPHYPPHPSPKEFFGSEVVIKTLTVEERQLAELGKGRKWNNLEGEGGEAKKNSALHVIYRTIYREKNFWKGRKRIQRDFYLYTFSGREQKISPQ